MTKILMHGCNGAMGQMISKLVQEDENAQIVAGIDQRTEKEPGYPVFASLEECTVEPEVIIDFSVTAALDGILDYSVKEQIPVVLCTTGYSEAQLKRIEEASQKVAILKSANMSLGINMLFKLVQTAATILSEADFDIEIVEKHHNQKIDAPSGTALALADAMNEVLHKEYEYKYDRSQDCVKRSKKEIGISAVRGGTIVGEHEVIFAGADEVVEFKHTAYSKAVFAKGAIQAAKYLVNRPAGWYTMKDVIG